MAPTQATVRKSQSASKPRVALALNGLALGTGSVITRTAIQKRNHVTTICMGPAYRASDVSNHFIRL